MSEAMTKIAHERNGRACWAFSLKTTIVPMVLSGKIPLRAEDAQFPGGAAPTKFKELSCGTCGEYLKGFALTRLRVMKS